MTDRNASIRWDGTNEQLAADVQEVALQLNHLGHPEPRHTILDPKVRAAALARSIATRYHMDLTGLDAAALQGVLDGILTDRFCGVPDPVAGGIHPLSWGATGGRWTKTSLTYSVDATGSGMQQAAVQAVIDSAFARWSITCPTLTFGRTTNDADLRVRFVGSDVDDRFGTVQGTAGSAAYPPDGDIRLDTAENWTAEYLYRVVIHEIGHALGLSHSTSKSALMYPFATNFIVGQALDIETAEAVNLMYGFEPGTQIPLNDRASSEGPALAVCGVPGWQGQNIVYDERAFMVWKGTSGDSSLYWSIFEESSRAWSPQRKIPDVGSSDGAAIYPIRLGGGPIPSFGLLMAWKGVGNDTTVYYSVNQAPTRYTNGAWDPTPWAAQQIVPGIGTSHRPALAELNGAAIMAWKGTPGDNGIYVSTFNGSTWAAQKRVHGVGTSEGLSLVSVTNEPASTHHWSNPSKRVYMVWKGVPGDSAVWMQWLDAAANSIWSGQRRVEYADSETNGTEMVAIGTSSAPAAVARRDATLFLCWKGVVGDSRLFIATYNKGDWTGQIDIADVGSSSRPAVILYRDRLHFVWKGIPGDNCLYTTTGRTSA